MGPCEEILKRNMMHYATYEELIKQSKTQSAKEAVNNEKAKEVDPSNKDHHDRLGLVNDLIATENEYIAVCTKIIKGYLLPMRAQTDLKISKDEIEMVFCNIEDIVKLHEDFVRDLEKNKQDLLVGEVISQFVRGTLKSRSGTNFIAGQWTTNLRTICEQLFQLVVLTQQAQNFTRTQQVLEGETCWCHS